MSLFFDKKQVFYNQKIKYLKEKRFSESFFIEYAIKKYFVIKLFLKSCKIKFILVDEL